MDKIKISLNKVDISFTVILPKQEALAEYEIKSVVIVTATKKKVSDRFINKVVNSYCVDNDVKLIDITEATVNSVTAEIPVSEIINFITE